MQEKKEKLDIQLTNLFSDNMELPFHKPKPRAGQVQRTKRYTIYPIAYLQEIIENLGKHGSSRSTVRFLLDSDLQLWFALEGRPNDFVPHHWQQASDDKTSASCISAGNIKFLKKTSTIEFINHSSGDFGPSFDSLKWVLAVLISHEENLPTNFLPEIIQVQELDNTGKLLNSHLVEKKDLIQELSPFIKEKEILIKNQPKEKKHHQDINRYQQPSKKRGISLFQKKDIFSSEETENIYSSEGTNPSSFFNLRNSQFLSKDLKRKPVDAAKIKEINEPNVVEQESNKPVV